MTRKNQLVVPASVGDLTAPSDWREKYSKFYDRDAAAATGGTGWPWLSTRSKHDFKLGDMSWGSDLEVVILGAIRENAYYDEQYDPQNPSAPACWALNTGLDEVTMAPPSDLKTRESEKCMGCWANAFKSDPKRGKGKACKNLVRLALLAFDENGEYRKVSGARLRLPPTALTAWSAYAKGINISAGRPIFSVVTRISIEPDDNTQFKLGFECIGLYNDDETLNVLASRAEDAIEHLESIPEVSADVPQGGGSKQGGDRKKVRRRVVKKKTTSRKAPRSRAK